MKDAKTLLAQGIETLRKNDEDVERLIMPRIEEIILLLARYIKEIELFNNAYGLVGASDTNELVIKHILDSLAPLGILYRLLGGIAQPKIADAGSGAGLPGIPLAVAMPNCGFTLIERMGRRAGFLCNTKAVLGLSNISIEESDFSLSGKTENWRFDLITFRAFKPLEPKLLKALFAACANEGAIAAYKGRLEKTALEMAPLEKTCQWETIPYSVPFLDEQRHLLVIKKKQ